MFELLICLAATGGLMVALWVMEIVFDLLPERMTDKLLALLGWDWD